jgi:hypothetical protein
MIESMTAKIAVGHGVGLSFPNFFMYSNRRRVKTVNVNFAVSLMEKLYIKSCAKKAGKSLAVYVREGALQGFQHRDKSLPQEVLAFQGQLAQVCGLLEVIARRRLDGEDLNALERVQLNEVRQSLQEFLQQIKTHLS